VIESSVQKVSSIGGCIWLKRFTVNEWEEVDVKVYAAYFLYGVYVYFSYLPIFHAMHAMSVSSMTSVWVSWNQKCVKSVCVPRENRGSCQRLGLDGGAVEGMILMDSVQKVTNFINL
jgi:hypothetical protein